MSKKTTEITTNNHYNEQELDCIVNVLMHKEMPESFFAEETSQLIAIEEREAEGEKVDPEEVKQLKQAIQQKKDRIYNEIAKNKKEYLKIIGTTDLETLTKDTHCGALSDYLSEELQPANPMERILVDQCAASHKLAMKLLGQIYEKINQFPIDKSQRLVNMTMRIMNASQQSAQIIHKMRNNGTQTVVVKHQNVQVNDGGQAMVTDKVVHIRGVGGETKK
jgi:cytochrome c551/c552